ncbi:MAG: AbrB/MazE/SpoVT family DNA-binding domain-containing protein [Rhodoferax sp.]|uniref:AbrB/MazE/SpoVT family DNA-binding domain-containing protein n=1 Tax=Rhodoferax sp. TaxID=50421 RepID=UPI001B45FAA6|nr:AbrB/MazE/SpoVT family DNA-binding domain-containing protein [Rhodoferax sp.]MBP9905741.1 AbrB/MazE/SpoVT family DNA-binding domain-containing protein [Rhodoferax sp.]
MQTHIVPIGNSLGLRLPKAVLNALHLVRASELSITVQADSIVLTPVRAPRAGWAAAFAAAPAAADESLWGEVPLTEAWDD